MTEDSQKKFDVLCKHNEKLSLCPNLDFKEQGPPVYHQHGKFIF